MSSLFTYTGEEIYQKLKTIFEDLSETSLKSSSIVSMIFRAVSYFILLITKQFNAVYENMWLSTCDLTTAKLYADEKGLEYDEAVASRTTIRYTRVSNTENAQAIPLGSRVSYNDYIFQTVDTYTFGIGETTCDAIVECTTEGSESNDIEIDKITTIVDSIPNVSSCTNISVTSGGSDAQTLSNFKEVIRSFPETYSCAGTGSAYKYFAKKADSSISDAYVYTKSAATVGIVILLEGGVIPSDEMITKVYDYVSDDEIRPLNDVIVVEKPSEYEYSIDFDFYISRSKESSSVSIETAITEAITSYTETLANSLGGSINPDALVNIALTKGAKRTILRSPSYIALDKTKIPKCTSINCNYLDIEDD